MTDDDFDKVDVDEDFADEFDFVDNNSGVKTAGNTQAVSSQSSTNFKTFSNFPLFKIMSATAIIIAIAFSYKHFMHNRKPLSNTVAPNAVSTTIDNAPAPITADAQSQDQLAQALPPGDKTFEQVQQDLKSPGTEQSTAIPDEINATLDSISQEMTLNVNQIKQLETTITNLTDTVDQLNKSISAMDNRVLGLTETVDNLSQDLNNVKKIMADDDIDLTSSSTVKLSATTPAITAKDSSPAYSVHAIIPGRAWLKSNKGQILTVTEGDKIGDYGSVAQIDATNGLVRTSSGMTFR